MIMVTFQVAWIQRTMTFACFSWFWTQIEIRNMFFSSPCATFILLTKLEFDWKKWASFFSFLLFQKGPFWMLEKSKTWRKCSFFIYFALVLMLSVPQPGEMSFGLSFTDCNDESKKLLIVLAA